MQRVRRAGLALGVGALSVLSFGDAVAQRRGDLTGDVILDAAGAPGGDFNVSQARRERGFRLFGGADGAGAGMHASGNLGYALDNYSPCDNPLSGFCYWNVRAARGGGTITFQFFEVLFAAGAPASDWARARKAVPSLANARGGGYTYLSNFGLFSGRYEWGPRDGTLSKLFSGVTAVSDGSCRDHRGFGNGNFGNFASGAPLLASSNCPDTWPGAPAAPVWGGDRTTALEGYQALFDADPTEFRFDFWQVPDSLKRAGPFMGTNFSTYGETSDHFTEVLGSYGSVIPGGSGDPTVTGWPMGLVWRFEAFNFGVPTYASTVFIRATVINRSEDVYGVGLDYDSLYLGFMPGTGGAGPGGGQAFSNYYMPEISTALYHQSHVTVGGPCSEGARQPAGVPGCTASAGMGMNNGGNAIIVLKSPIGDLRNKHFSNPASPFYNTGHPLVGDTITFNHGHQCGFGSCWATTHNVNDKRSFGMISSTEANVLDGRDPAALTPGEAFITFRNKGFPTERGKFNKYVPGEQGPPAATWDYNKDGTPDTLYYDSCADQGCVVASADTFPGGQKNAYGNVGGILAAGPFPLAAGDSTSWFVAFVGDADSVRTWASINAAIDLYMNFFLSPEAPPPVTIASTQVTAGTIGELGEDPEVTFFFDDAPERWVDQFLLKLSEDVRTSPSFATLRAKNPGLADEMAARAADNLEAIEIYKSCNGGNTWTGDGNCVGDPVTDVNGQSIGLGWQAYAIFDVDANSGDVPNVFTDNTVTPGRSYVYTVVGKSRGAEFQVIDEDDRPTVISFAPTIRNTLSSSSSDPNVLSVYIPASRAAGYRAAQISFSALGEATVPLSVGVSDAPTPGNYQIAFGNRITVERDSIIADDACGPAGTVCGTRVILARVVNAAPGGTSTVVRRDTLFRDGADEFPVSGAASSSAATTVGNFRRLQTVYDALGFVVAAGSTPIFASRTLTGNAATPTGVFALADFPGFTVAANNATAGAFNSATERAYRGAATRQLLGLPDTAVVIPRGNVDRFMAQWREQNSVRGPFGVGQYMISWAGDAFGLPRGLSSLGASSEAELTAALQGRPVASTGLTDAATATLLSDAGLAAGVVTQQDLVAVKAPFTIRNTTFGRDVSIAMVRRTMTQGASVANTYRLGRNADTLRVGIPADEWVPGDLLYFIETVTRDSTEGANVVLDGSLQPLRVTNPQVTFTGATIGCNQPNPPFCNPLGPNILGSSGWLATSAGDSVQFEYNLGFSPTDRWVFDLTAPVAGTEITEVTDSTLAAVRVVPNPFVVFSSYQTTIADSRVLFTNVPPTGALRVYTVAGQFVQQISWTADDLTGTGDLFWNLKSREDIDIASGLYIWVITAPSNPTDPTSAPVTARGKFVVIRGQSR
jgi:hypothetical protein